MKKIILLFLASVLAFASCKKDTPLVDPNPNPPITNNRNFTQVTTSVAGVVVDRNNQAVADAEVTFGQTTVMTDMNGVFKIENQNVMENRAYVKVSKDGYFHGSRSYFAYANQSEFVRISLLEKTIQGTVSTSGGEVTTPEGVKLNFPANAVANADGTPYTGTVNVAAQYLDPTAADLAQIMPGDLRGITTDNIEEGLSSFGMVAVELLGSGGEVLNVADGKTVQLTMPVAATQTSAAPAEIPLWYFDEIEGVWREEGKATLQGNKYIGDVSHFTFWNCDINWDLIYLDGSVLLDGNAFADALVCLTFENNGYTYQACDNTNSMGVFSGQVPTNTTFEIVVYGTSTPCGVGFYNATIGPFSADETLADINITNVSNEITVTGNLTDCDNTPVTDGYAIIEVGQYTYYATTSDGTINYTFVDCGSNTDISVRVVDLNSLTESEVASFPINSNAVDLGTIQACVSLDEYIIFDFDGATYTFVDYISIYYIDSIGYTEENLTGQGSNQQWFSLTTDGDAVGTFPINNFWTNTPNNPNGINTTNMTISFTQFSSVVGEICKGTFDGTVDQNGTMLPITGSFKAIRD